MRARAHGPGTSQAGGCGPSQDDDESSEMTQLAAILVLKNKRSFAGKYNGRSVRRELFA